MITFLLLRWLTGWGNLINGIVIILTFGFYRSDIDLWAEKWFLDYCEMKELKEGLKNEKNN